MNELFTNPDFIRTAAELILAAGSLILLKLTKTATDDKNKETDLRKQTWSKFTALLDFVNPNTPTTPQQISIMGEVDKSVWTMKYQTKQTIFDIVKNAGAGITYESLNDLITRAEEKGIFEYGLIVDDITDTQKSNLDIQYGKILIVGNKNEILTECALNAAQAITIT